MSIATDDEKGILVNALPSGQIYVMKTDQTGEFVRSGSFDYFDARDPGLQARAIEALQALIQRRWVRHEGGQLYKLTGTGFERARDYSNN
jgi:hypothetical protein